MCLDSYLCKTSKTVQGEVNMVVVEPRLDVPGQDDREHQGVLEGTARLRTDVPR